MWISSEKIFRTTAATAFSGDPGSDQKKSLDLPSPVNMRVPEKRVRKILISKNLDIKILITEDLEKSR